MAQGSQSKKEVVLCINEILSVPSFLVDNCKLNHTPNSNALYYWFSQTTSYDVLQTNTPTDSSIDADVVYDISFDRRCKF